MTTVGKGIDSMFAAMQGAERVDQAIASRKGTVQGTGCVECPLCGNRIDYTFDRTSRRLVVRFRCRTDGCIRGMS